MQACQSYLSLSHYLSLYLALFLAPPQTHCTHISLTRSRTPSRFLFRSLNELCPGLV